MRKWVFDITPFTRPQRQAVWDLIFSGVLYFARQMRFVRWYQIKVGYIPGYNFSDMWYFCWSDMMYVMVCLGFRKLLNCFVSRYFVGLSIGALIYDIATPFMPLIVNDPFKVRSGEVIYMLAGIYFCWKKKGEIPDC